MNSPVQKKIFIVEDDAVLSNLYRIKFEKEGYRVMVCANGIDAVTQVVDFAPDAILLDIMMPTMNGFETLGAIRHLAPSLRTKIFMFSNLNGQSDIDRAMELGADGYFLKAQTTPREVFQRVEESFEIDI